MVAFGLLSTGFDVLTFAWLRLGLHAGPELFRTVWFVESLLTELLVALVVRTRRRFYQSRPGTVLLVSTVALVPIAFAIPYLPLVPGLLGFVPMPAAAGMVVAITLGFLAATEALKTAFYGVRGVPGEAAAR